MTRKEIVAFLTHEKDLDLAQLVKDVEQERKVKEDNDRKLWLADVEETEKFLLQSLLDYIETIFGVALTKEDEKEFENGVKRMTEQLVAMREGGNPTKMPGPRIMKKTETPEDFLKAFAKML